MKKVIALILCLAMLGCCAAFAEGEEKELIGTISMNGAFNIKCKLMEGYKVSIVDSDSLSLIAVVSSEDKTKPTFTVSIAYSDMYAADYGSTMRLNDVSEEDMAMIKDSFVDNTENTTFEDRETAYGTKLLIVQGNVGDKNFVDIYSIYNAYEVEVVAVAGEEAAESTLTEEQIQMIITFLSDMDFEPIEG